VRLLGLPRSITLSALSTDRLSLSTRHCEG
jgi:hypothetical protein